MTARQTTIPLRPYEVGIRGFKGYHWDGKLVVYASSRGRAKSAFLHQIADSWEPAYTTLTCRAMGTPWQPQSTPAELAKAEADAFNAANPIGTMLRYWSGLREGSPSGVAPISHPATVMCDRPVIWMRGVSSCHSLTHVEVVAL